uniref:Uncharacterized protein n=1 Tax=Utricularia reniformis TaxID=192314 RepID=A0A1Y0B1A3_9LAMI|nr:hypothetical protein AEK19_MT0928 [Utricularia reniformis]ART31154.1 hypothetical protein AEK19_MT0928 [Utricularia reniformis]
MWYTSRQYCRDELVIKMLYRKKVLLSAVNKCFLLQINRMKLTIMRFAYRTDT